MVGLVVVLSGFLDLSDVLLELGDLGGVSILLLHGLDNRGTQGTVPHSRIVSRFVRY